MVPSGCVRLAAGVILLLGCAQPMRVGRDASGSHCEPLDSDGDGIADDLEGLADFDEDGLSNRDDLDSDGDLIPDTEESPSAAPCDPAPDCDEDSAPDFLDRDRDGDGVGDERERGLGQLACERDSDHDGCTDAEELLDSACPSLTRVTSTCADPDFEVKVAIQASGVIAPVTLELGSIDGFNPVISDAFRVELALRDEAGGARADGAWFIDPQPSSNLVFRVTRDTALEPTYVVECVLVAQTGEEVGREIMLFETPRCP